MAEKTAVENRRIPDFQELMTVTLTLDWVILHTVVDGRTFETGFIRSTLKSRLTTRQHSVACLALPCQTETGNVLPLNTM